MPVLPEVGSTRTPRPGAILPCFSSASIIETPMRSLTLPIGLKNSSLASKCAPTPFSLARRSSRTSGVSPIVSVIESKMRPRPGARPRFCSVSAAAIFPNSNFFPGFFPKSRRSIGKSISPASGVHTIFQTAPAPSRRGDGQSSRKRVRQDAKRGPSGWRAGRGWSAASLSNREIAARLFFLENMRGDRLVAKIVDRHRVEIGEEGLASFLDRRLDDSLDQFRGDGELFRIGGAERQRGADDFADADLTALAGELIAAARPAHAFQDVGVDEPLDRKSV